MSESEPLLPLLPLEIVVKILCRLPPKSLLRFRSVCKSWCSLIADPSFISLHRRHSPQFILLSLLKERFRSLFGHRLSSLRFDDPLLTVSLPSHLDLNSLIPATCHGLLCIGTWNSKELDYSSLIICNPSLRRFLSLPKPLPLPFPQLIYTATVAFGFDAPNHDYKIVRMVFGDDDDEDILFRGYHSRVEVYSLSSGIWRTLPPSPVVAPPCTIYRGGPHTSHGFVNGLVHWGARRRVEVGNHVWFYFFVLSFDFVDEVFHELSLPESLSRASSERASITVVGGSTEKSLSVYHLSGDSPCNGSIWVMKEYGVVESWIKVFHFNFTGSRLEAPSFGITIANVIDSLDKPLCVTNDGEKLLTMLSSEPGKRRLCLLDLEKKGFIDLEFGDQRWDLYSDCYAETLVLLDEKYAGALMSY